MTFLASVVFGGRVYAVDGMRFIWIIERTGDPVSVVIRKMAGLDENYRLVRDMLQRQTTVTLWS